MTSSSGHSLAGGGTETSHSSRFPSFAADPAAWFEHVDAILASEPPLVRTAVPDTWTDPAGHRWRVVITTDGPEVRPDLQHPFIRDGGLPRLASLHVSPTHVTAELSMNGWRDVSVFAAGTIAVRDLGLAMLTGLELPHEGVDRIGPETWERATARWAALRSRDMVAIEVRGLDIEP